MHSPRPLTKAECQRLQELYATHEGRWLSMLANWQADVLEPPQHFESLDSELSRAICVAAPGFVEFANAESGFSLGVRDALAANKLYELLPPAVLKSHRYDPGLWNAVTLWNADLRAYAEKRWHKEGGAQIYFRLLLQAEGRARLTRHALARLWLAAHLVNAAADRIKAQAPGMLDEAGGRAGLLERFFSNQSTAEYMTSATDLRDPQLLAGLLLSFPSMKTSGEHIAADIGPRIVALGALHEFAALRLPEVLEVIRVVDTEATTNRSK